MLNQQKGFSVLPICREYFSVRQSEVPFGDNRPTDEHLKTVYAWALRDSEKTSHILRITSYARIGAAGVVTAIVWGVASLNLALIVSVFAVAVAIVGTVNDWGTKATSLAVFGCDQALHLHDANVEAIGSSIDALAAELTSQA